MALALKDLSAKAEITALILSNQKTSVKSLIAIHVKFIDGHLKEEKP